MPTRYRRDEHDDLPDTSAYNPYVVIRRTKAQQAMLGEMAKELARQGALDSDELEGLLKSDYDAYCQRKIELERKH